MGEANKTSFWEKLKYNIFFLIKYLEIYLTNSTKYTTEYFKF